MIVVYGTRMYGRVDGHDGEFASTRFAHIWWVPLFPLGSFWVTQDHGDSFNGHAIRLSGRSVGAGYGRVWGPIAAVAGVASGGLAGFAVAGVAAAATAWSWRTRSVRSAREQRRGTYHALAFGTRCDPLRMSRRLAESLRPDVEARWAMVSGSRSPDDVARFGAESGPQAVMAYAVLRLVARTARGAQARRAREASERILDAARELDGALAEGGPYRAAALPGTTPQSL